MPLGRLPGWVLSALLVGLMGALLGVARIDLPLYRALMQEDGWGEWGTFLAFVVAAWVGVGAARRAPDRVRTVWLSLLSAFCLFVAGEEVSWGQRLLGFAPPDVFLEHNYQQESNLHNLLKQVLDTRWMVLMIAAGYGVLLPLGRGLASVRGADRLQGMLSWLAPASALAPAFAAVALLEASYPVTLSGEVAELGLGLCFLADLSLRCDVAPARGRARALGLSIATLVAASLVPVAVDAWTGAHAAEETARARRELEELAADLRVPGVVQQRLRGKRRVHKRMFTAVRAAYLRFGEGSGYLGGAPTPAERPDAETARRDPRGYFMDPWLQPYWVRYERVGPDRGRLLIYSFGANRRRDTRVHELARIADASELLAGDDVGVTLEVQWH